MNIDDLDDPRIRVIDHDRRIKARVPLAIPRLSRKPATPYVVQLDSDNLLGADRHGKMAVVSGVVSRNTPLSRATRSALMPGTYLWQQGFHNGEFFSNTNLVDITGCAAPQRSIRRSAAMMKRFGVGLEDWDFWLRLRQSGLLGHNAAGVSRLVPATGESRRALGDLGRRDA